MLQQAIHIPINSHDYISMGFETVVFTGRVFLSVTQPTVAKQ